MSKRDTRTDTGPGGDPTLPATGMTPAARIGGRIGRFSTIGMLGSGGMGVVLEAHDPELDRRVAIKLMKADSRARTQREAQAMAKLSHPNVVAVYEVGRTDDQTFIAMELVEGSTLRTWMEAPHPWREVVAMFVAAGRGLAAAHGAGMVHRDFKPENVLVGKDGRARVSDFGLVSGEHAAFDTLDSGSPTVSLTLDGSAVGTPAYMSPEHWAGDGVDARSDQFSFCVALWEALWRRRPFRGDGAATLRHNVLAGQIGAPPDAPGVPAWLERTLRRGLAHDPAARWPDMAALLGELERGLAPRRLAPWLALGAVVVAAGGAVAVLALRDDGTRVATKLPAPPPPPAGLALGSIERITFDDGCEEGPALTADGATVYYDASVGTDLHLFSLRTGERPVELTHTAGYDQSPTPSPDGKRLAYLHTDAEASAAIAIADVATPEATRLYGSGLATAPFWSPDSSHVWSGELGKLSQYDAATGVVTRVIALAADHFPYLGLELPGGDVIALVGTLETAGTADGVLRFAAGATEPEVLHSGRFWPILALLPAGDAVMIGTTEPGATVALWRVPLGGGAPTQLTSGAIAARSRASIVGERLVWSDCTSLGTLAAFDADGYVDIAHSTWHDWSPAGRPGSTEMYFLSDRSGSPAIHRTDRARPGPTTTLPVGELSPSELQLSPDGSLLVFAADDGVYVAATDGASPPRRLAPDATEPWPVIDRTASTVYFLRIYDRRPHVSSVPIAGGEVTKVIAETSAMPAPSPTDDVLAYLEMPHYDQMVPMLLDLRTGKRRPVLPGGEPGLWDYLRWSPDGKRLLLVRLNTRVVEVDVATGRILRDMSVGADQLDGITYVGDELLVGRQRWSGDLWQAQLLP